MIRSCTTSNRKLSQQTPAPANGEPFCDEIPKRAKNCFAKSYSIPLHLHSPANLPALQFLRLSKNYQKLHSQAQMNKWNLIYHFQFLKVSRQQDYKNEFLHLIVHVKWTIAPISKLMVEGFSKPGIRKE